jgi:uncharacterized membrane protein required for colicin V production
LSVTLLFFAFKAKTLARFAGTHPAQFAFKKKSCSNDSEFFSFSEQVVDGSQSELQSSLKASLKAKLKANLKANNNITRESWIQKRKTKNRRIV